MRNEDDGDDMCESRVQDLEGGGCKGIGENSHGICTEDRSEVESTVAKQERNKRETVASTIE